MGSIASYTQAHFGLYAVPYTQVIEETILSYPKDENDTEKQSSAKKKKEEPKKDDKKGKKKKDLDQDMRHEPPEYRALATFEVDLADFLVGEVEFSQILAKSGVQVNIPHSKQAEQLPKSCLTSCLFAVECELTTPVFGLDCCSGF